MTERPATGNGGPLDGYRVLDLTHFLAGPYAAMTLGDMGADVLKVEPPRGDPMRRLGDSFVGGESTLFLSVNRNKRSLVLDLKRSEGADLALELAGRCDVVMHNYRPGVAERLGLGYEHVKARNDRVVYCALSAFGGHGPDAGRPAVDPIIQAMSGLMSITGHPEGPPVQVGSSIADIAGGLMAAQGILLALLARERFGVGQRVTASMLDGTISLLTGREGEYLATGRVPGRAGNVIRHAAPSGLYETSDGSIMLAVMTEALWHGFCTALGRPDLSDDPRFASNTLRVRHRDELDAIIRAVLVENSTERWLEVFTDHDVLAGPVNDLAAALDNEQVRVNDMVVTTEHPTAGTVRSLGIPIKLLSTPGAVRRPAPLLGQHSHEALGAVGLSDEAYERLRSEGVVSGPPAS